MSLGGSRHRFGGLDRALQKVVETGSGAVDVVEAAAERLLKVVPADVWCAVLLDPSTLLDTGGVHRAGFPEHVMPRLFEIEHVEQDDVDNLRALTRRSTPVSSLRVSTGGALDTSGYYRDILQPLDLADELRVLLRERGRTWGMLVLCRATDSAPFDARDLAAARTLATPATRAVRRALVVGGVDEASITDGPGVLVLDHARRMIVCSPSAERMMARIEDAGPTGRPTSCPYAVHAVAAAARAGRPGTTARSRVRTRDGRWLELHAWHSLTEPQPVTMVSIGPAEPGLLVPLVLAAYGLSEQQQRIARLVMHGHSSEEVLAALHITRNTLNDHLEKIFDKVGVRSRRELPAALFSRHYLPRLGLGPLTLDGRLTDPHVPHIRGVSPLRPST
ncbi:LuxR C-terminal-related transcriptional regulator [Embleya sp. NPDC056575]|uniref:helix-turn-helix transcriptional regulator n=1 Tax=unclassified Embleya TaxID=2699296 RepID=UPI0036BBD814